MNYCWNCGGRLDAKEYCKSCDRQRTQVEVSKIEITDEMAARANAAQDAALDKGIDVIPAMRRALDAALNPPLVPEVTITNEMIDAALDALTRYSDRTDRLWKDFTASEIAPIIYRAMFSVRPQSGTPNRAWPIESPDNRG